MKFASKILSWLVQPMKTESLGHQRATQLLAFIGSQFTAQRGDRLVQVIAHIAG